MSLIQTIVLAIVQGVTEFLPISSTAHLILVPWFLGWTDPGLTFNVALHAGTLLAVLVYFARDWWAMLTGVLGRLLGKRAARSTRGLQPDFDNTRLFSILVVATIPAGLAGYLLEDYAETAFRSPILVAGMLIGVSVLMWVVDRRTALERRLDSVGFLDGIIIGFAQAVALLPGTSRSGITIVAGLFRNLTRETAARFSFLLATPIIAGATLKKAVEVSQVGLPQGIAAIDLVTGFVVSALVGYAAIAFLLRYLQVRTLKIFVAYRLLLGGIILAVEFLRSSA